MYLRDSNWLQHGIPADDWWQILGSLIAAGGFTWAIPNRTTQK